jgi:hypothetical protein
VNTTVAVDSSVLAPVAPAPVLSEVKVPSVLSTTEADTPAADEEEKKLKGGGQSVSSKQTPSDQNHAPPTSPIRLQGKGVLDVGHESDGESDGKDPGTGESEGKGASAINQGAYTSVLRVALNSTHESGKGRELKFSSDNRGKKTYQNVQLWNRSLAANPTVPGGLHWATVLATEEATTAETRMLELAVVTSTTPHADGGPAHSVANGVVVAVPGQQGSKAQISCVVVSQATGQICNGFSWAVGLQVNSLNGEVERPPRLVPFRVDILKEDSFKGYLDPDEVKVQVAGMLELALKDIVDATKRKELEQNHRMDFQRAAEVSRAHSTPPRPPHPTPPTPTYTTPPHPYTAPRITGHYCRNRVRFRCLFECARSRQRLGGHK